MCEEEKMGSWDPPTKRKIFSNFIKIPPPSKKNKIFVLKSYQNGEEKNKIKINSGPHPLQKMGFEDNPPKKNPPHKIVFLKTNKLSGTLPKINLKNGVRTNPLPKKNYKKFGRGTP